MSVTWTTVPLPFWFDLSLLKLLFCPALFSLPGWIFIKLKWWLVSASPYHHHTTQIPSRNVFTLLCALRCWLGGIHLQIPFPSDVQLDSVIKSHQKEMGGREGVVFLPVRPFCLRARSWYGRQPVPLGLELLPSTPHPSPSFSSQRLQGHWSLHSLLHS